MLLAKRKREVEIEVPEQKDVPGVRGVTHSIVLPIRQTASIFKQSVTVIRNQESKHSDIVHGQQEKPKQVFWERRLQGIQACNKSGKVIDTFQLPPKIKGVGVELGAATLVRSIATALHVHPHHAVVGQSKPRALLEKAPHLHLNPRQPLVLGLHVTDEDIAEQEKRVLEARNRLKEALAA